jgi:hypothetical protein
VLLEQDGFQRLGERLDRWDRLADAVADNEARDGPGLDLEETVSAILNGERGKPAPAAAGKAAGPAKAARRTGGRRRPDHRRPLRVAVAGIHIKDRESFAAAITRFAGQYEVGGRVLATADPDQASIAELVPLDSPFQGRDSATSFEIAKWMDRAIRLKADIIMADFGGPEPSEIFDHLLKDVGAANILAITAGSNDARPIYPGWSKEAFAVGPLAAADKPTGNALWDPAVGKPDLFARDSVKGTVLEQAVTNPDDHGSSLAALNAVAAAILVWATDRTLDAAGVRGILTKTATEVEPRAPAGAPRARKGQRRPTPAAPPSPPRALSLTDALNAAREGVLLRALERGPLEIRQLINATGLRALITVQLAESLAARGLVRRSVEPEGEVYSLPAPAPEPRPRRRKRKAK